MIISIIVNLIDLFSWTRLDKVGNQLLYFIMIKIGG